MAALTLHHRDPAIRLTAAGLEGLIALNTLASANRPGKDSNACMGPPVNGVRSIQPSALIRLPLFARVPAGLLASSKGEARCLANQIVRVSLYPVEPHGLATMIPPARNGLRSNGPISLSVLHPSIAPVTSNPSRETTGSLKPSRARPPGSIPSRGTATGLRSACAPKQQSQCAVCGPERS